MMRGLAHLLLAAVLGMAAGRTGLHAQPTEVALSSYGFSNGVHPTFAVTFDAARTATVEDHWRGILRSVSHKVGGRRELVARTALIPAIAPDTMQVLVKGVAVKGTGQVVCHVAFHTVNGYLGPTSEPEAVEAARSFVQRHSVALRRALAQGELAAAERFLAQYRRDRTTLRRDQDRATDQRDRHQEKDSIALADQDRLAREVQAKEAEIEAFKARIGTSTDPADQAALKALEKERQKLRGRLAAAERSGASARRRTENLTRNLERNAKAQADMERLLERQEALVQELKAKLAAIH
ncbi:MAG: hypothetical protein RBT71_02540 [Flavobacteriales bacterium]|jgi:hypothetical protein|nr:hypothetical protein [Flavobacteriales bacterium]